MPATTVSAAAKKNGCFSEAVSTTISTILPVILDAIAPHLHKTNCCLSSIVAHVPAMRLQSRWRPVEFNVLDSWIIPGDTQRCCVSPSNDYFYHLGVISLGGQVSVSASGDQSFHIQDLTRDYREKPLCLRASSAQIHLPFMGETSHLNLTMCPSVSTSKTKGRLHAFIWVGGGCFSSNAINLDVQIR